MTEKLVLGSDQAVALLRKVVYGREEYVYERFPASANLGSDDAGYCLNFDLDGNPSCVVGHVLVEMGLSFEQAEVLGIATNRAVCTVVPILNEYPEFGWSFSQEAENVLTAAQQAQDDGRPWGEALEEAERVAFQ